MTGVVFLVTIPKAEEEEEFQKETKQQSYSEVSLPKSSSDITNDDVKDTVCSSSRSSYVTAEEYYTVNENETKLDKEDWIRSSNFKITVEEINKVEEETQTTGANPETASCEQVLKDVLRALQITNASWNSSCSNTHHHVMFTVHGRARSERALRTLRNAGIGARARTSLGVVPCTLHYRPDDDQNSEETDEDSCSTWTAFVRSVRARQTVQLVVQQVKADAALTFDFLSLLFVAAFVAAMGLLENSTVFLVASMLISPLMGPITAGTFGTAIRDRDLFKTGVLNELYGLFLALLIGFAFGLIVCTMSEGYDNGDWLTEEILSRCDVRSLWVGVLVAIPSGAAVAISVLADNTASLVGVAISASLLPPAVNAGLLWGLSLIHLVYMNDSTRLNYPVKTQVFSDNPAAELAINGLISLALTLVNIVCIYFAGIFVYMIKEVAPVSSPDMEFWKHDIKAVRNFNRTLSEEAKAHISDEDTISGNMENIMHNDSAKSRMNLEDDLFDMYNCRRGDVTKTWSPIKPMTRRVSVKELHGIYKQCSEENSALRKSKIVRNTPKRGYERLDEETKSANPPEKLEGSFSQKPKFTVVPVRTPTDEVEIHQK